MNPLSGPFLSLSRAQFRYREHDIARFATRPFLLERRGPHQGPHRRPPFPA